MLFKSYIFNKVLFLTLQLSFHIYSMAIHVIDLLLNILKSATDILKIQLHVKYKIY